MGTIFNDHMSPNKHPESTTASTTDMSGGTEVLVLWLWKRSAQIDGQLHICPLAFLGTAVGWRFPFGIVLRSGN